MMEDNPLLIYRFWVFFMSWKLCNFCNKLNHTSVLFYFEEEPISSGVPSSLTKLKTYWWRSALGVAFRGSEGHPRDIFLLLLINMLTIHFVVPLLFLLFFFTSFQFLEVVFRRSTEGEIPVRHACWAPGRKTTFGTCRNCIFSVHMMYISGRFWIIPGFILFLFSVVAAWRSKISKNNRFCSICSHTHFMLKCLLSKEYKFAEKKKPVIWPSVRLNYLNRLTQ